jgi:hypothetical protein
MEKRCILCNCIDETGLINNMCTDCFDMSLDIGKVDRNKKEWKKKSKELEERREANNYYKLS